MGFLDKLQRALKGGSTSSSGGGGSSSFGDDKRSYWVYASCQRCGEPLKARIDLMNEPSEDDDGNWVVRKGLTGNARNYCFQTVEVTLRFDAKKDKIVDSEVSGGRILSPDDYRESLLAWEQRSAEAASQAEQEPAANEAEPDAQA